MQPIVLMDFFGTLARPRGAWTTLEDLLSDRGYIVKKCDLLPYVQEGADGHLHLAASRSRAAYHRWKVSRLAAFLEGRHSDPLDEAGNLLDELERRRSETGLELAHGAREALVNLADAGAGVVVCSNWGWDLEETLEYLGVREQLLGVVCSARAGARKPNPEIFRQALGSPASARRAVMIGDHPVADGVGALNAGMKAACIVHSEPSPAARHLADSLPTLTLHPNLTEAVDTAMELLGV
jgi:putative hydrolase of the HAD superfamily